MTASDDGSDIQGRSKCITQPLGSCGCLWKLRMIIGSYITAINFNHITYHYKILTIASFFCCVHLQTAQFHTPTNTTLVYYVYVTILFTATI